MNLETHAHTQDSHDHSHGHASGHAPQRARPGFSFLRASWRQRLVLALALVAAIWAGVLWAWA